MVGEETVKPKEAIIREEMQNSLSRQTVQEQFVPQIIQNISLDDVPTLTDDFSHIEILLSLVTSPTYFNED